MDGWISSPIFASTGGIDFDQLLDKTACPHTLKDYKRGLFYSNKISLWWGVFPRNATGFDLAFNLV